MSDNAADGECTVLIVDRTEADARATATGLGLQNCRTEIATTLKAAVAVVESFGPRVVVLEMALVGENGLELLPALPTGSASPAVVVYTACGDNDLLRRRALEQGAAEYLDKSIGPDALRVIVERHLQASGGAVASARLGDHILVVDDEPLICQYVAKFLRQHGYRVEYVHTADAGRDAILKELPRALLLDIEMPGRTGLDLLRELNEKGIRLPTIIITGVEEHHIGIEAESLGIVGFLSKPFTLNYLQNSVLTKLELLTG